MNSSQFYVCDWSLLIYETKDIAALPGNHTGKAAIETAEKVKYWLERDLKSKVEYTQLNEPIFVLKKEENDKFWNVIVGEKIGWIIAEEWMELKLLF